MIIEWFLNRVKSPKIERNLKSEFDIDLLERRLAEFDTEPGLACITEIPLTGGDSEVTVVGEARYQDNLEQICGGKTTKSVDRTETAQLILEDSNPYDRNAVSVEINGLKVGYLDREDAKIYRRYLKIKGHPNAIGTCQANIRGGWKRSDEDQGHFGVWLYFDLYD